ncbi:cysteine--tRNA ligase [bacterium]
MLMVYNTLTKKKEKFRPIHPPFVGMYVCGPTVYDDPHLGHAKSYVSFDVIYRFLKAEGFKVRYVQNITDVGHLLGDGDEGEDRVLKRARVEKLEPVEVAQKYENHYFRDMDLLNCLRPNISSRATGHIPEMIELVETLLSKGFAYEEKGNVYFDISKFKDYGKLSGRRIEDLMEGTRVKIAKGKKNPADFALWKEADTVHIMQWASPWGRGYPGWHLECSVMAMKYLGKSVDIHGGGIDNQFPHHECEIAQSEGATGKHFVKYWLHNNMVTVDGKKMSKSLNNFITLQDLFEKYDPMTVRFFVLQGHYRSPQDFSDTALDAANKGFRRLASAVNELREKVNKKIDKDFSFKNEWIDYKNSFFKYMEDDFNTSGAIAVLFDLVKKAAGLQKEEDILSAESLFISLGEDILGLRFSLPASWEKTGPIQNELMNILIDLRQEFREKKEWERADKLRDRLKKMGIEIKDGKKGTTWVK